MTKLRRSLWPPLPVVATNLPGILVPVMTEDIPPNSVNDAVPEAASITIPARPLSPVLNRAIERRIAVTRATFPTSPQKGQIVAVSTLEGPYNARPTSPVERPYVVLLEERIEKSSLWYGWLVSPEVDYASWWDFVVEASDGPCDPLAGMVQLWNPVYVSLPNPPTVLAELTAARLAAVHSLVADFLTAPEPNPADANPGRMVPRLTQAGFSVMTGTPLGTKGDPRLVYQTLYHDAAEPLRETARAVLRAGKKGWIEALREYFRAAANAVGTTLLPVPEVAHAMGSVPENHEVLGGWVRLDLTEETVNGDSVLIVTCAPIDDATGTIRLYQGNELLQEEQLNVDPSKVRRILIDPILEYTLVFEGGSPHCRVEVPWPAVK